MMRLALIIAMTAATAASCRMAEQKSESAASADASATPAETKALFDSLVAAGTPQATFAGGCFWCVEPAFDTVPGVVATISGYIGGTKASPTYNEVSSGGTGHAEAVTIFYDSSIVDYASLLDVFWHNVDPTTPDRQFCDVGSQYRSAIFPLTPAQRRLAEESKRALDASGRFAKPVVTTIENPTAFTPAEEYHQDFYKKDPVRYKEYRLGCGRDRRLEELWE